MPNPIQDQKIKWQDRVLLIACMPQRFLDKRWRESRHCPHHPDIQLDEDGECPITTDVSILWDALVEIDIYLANDPDVWRIGSVAKVGDVLCDVLGADIIQRINAGVTANLCAKCRKPWRAIDRLD